MIRTENLTFEYETMEEGGERIIALKNLQIEIEEGSFTAILGRNGSGKSTLAKNFNGLYLPTEGCVLVDGMDTAEEARIWDIRRKVGMVFQNPDNQIVASIVEDDVAFGPENLGIPTEEIRSRIDTAMKSTGIYEQRLKAPSLLSGGQKQRVAIAGVIAMLPKCIVFDEPTAMLDPRGRQDVMNIIQKLHRQGITVVLITHFMEEACMADRVLIMEDGQVLSDGTPTEIFLHPEKIREAGLTIPPAVRMAEMLRMRGVPVPVEMLDTDALAQWLTEKAPKLPKLMNAAVTADVTVAATGTQNANGQTADAFLDAEAHQENPEADKRTITDTDNAPETKRIQSKADTAMQQNVAHGTDAEVHCAASTPLTLKIEHLRHIYHAGLPDETVALDDVSFTIAPGEFIGIIGHTGSGKSTLIQHLNGLLKPRSGKILPELTREVRKKIGLVFQYPEYQLFEETVAKDIAFGPKNLGLSEEEQQQRVRDAMELVGLPYELYAERSPFELSGGQKRRAAIAGVIAMQPEILILDEPTAGLDPTAHREILQMIQKIRAERGCAIVFVSHNMDDVAKLCTKVLVMEKGRLVLQGTPAEVFAEEALLQSIGLGLTSGGTLIHALRKRGAADLPPAVREAEAVETVINYLRGKAE